MKKFVLAILALCAPTMLMAQEEICYVDAFSQGRLGPVEYGTKAAEVATYLDILRYRAACELTDTRDKQYFDDLAAGLACSESPQFLAWFDNITGDAPSPPFDFSRETISDPAKFDEFCARVHDIDPQAFAANGALVDPMPEDQKGVLDKATIFGSMNAR